MPLRGAGYSTEAIEQFYDRGMQALTAVAGVESVAAAQTTPFAPSQAGLIFLPDRDQLPIDPRQYPTFYTVTPDFFRTMGMAILRGRAFTPDDRATTPPVMILEDALARALFTGEDALGKCVIVGERTSPCRTVVGISTNTRRFVTTADGALRYYVPLAQRVSPITVHPRASRQPGGPECRAASGVGSSLPGAGSPISRRPSVAPRPQRAGGSRGRHRTAGR